MSQDKSSIEVQHKLDEVIFQNNQLQDELSYIKKMNTFQFRASSQSNEEIDLREIGAAIWAKKWMIVLITFMFAISSIFYALSEPDEYQSTVLLAPASTSASSISKLASKFGGIASLAGINLKNGGEDKTQLSIEIIKTWDFLEKFIFENEIEVAVFASNGWDRTSNKLIYDPDIYDERSNRWVRDFEPSKGQKIEPSGWELYEELNERVKISQDKMTGVIRLSVEFYSPFLAKSWADKLVKTINKHIQKKDKEEALRNINYLKEQVNLTQVTEMRSVFYELIEEQTKTLMLAEVNDEYVFKVLSPAKVAEEKSKPLRAIIVILGTLFGGIIATIIALIVHFKRKTK